MPIVAILAAGLAGFAFGAFWYMRFGDAWREAAALSEEAVAGIMRGYRPYLVAFAANLIVAGAMRHIFASGGFSGVFSGLLTGFELGLGVAAPWVALAYAFAGRGLRLTLIDAGHVVGACTAMGLVLGLFV